MSMDKPAIEQIQKAEAIKASNAVIAAMPEHIKPVVALPKDYDLHDMEQHLQQRFRFRGSFSTQSLAAFGAYAQHHALPTPQAAFIDADNMRAKLVLNLGNHEQPGHCDNTAHITLAKTAAYEALLNIVDREKSQQEIAEFIEDWRHNLAAMSEADIDGNNETIPIVRALQAIRSITIEAVSKQDSDVRNFGHTTSGMDSIDAKANTRYLLRLSLHASHTTNYQPARFGCVYRSSHGKNLPWCCASSASKSTKSRWQRNFNRSSKPSLKINHPMCKFTSAILALNHQQPG